MKNQSLLAELDEAEHKAIDSLARYKFAMFGYWAGIWVHLNRISGENRPSPFKPFVDTARKLKCAQSQEETSAPGDIPSGI